MEKANVELKLFDDRRERPEDLWRHGIAAQQSAGKNDLKKLLHGLQPRQIELEMENEELRRSQAQLVASKPMEVEKRTAAQVKTNKAVSVPISLV